MLSNYNKATADMVPDPNHQLLVDLTQAAETYNVEVWESDVIVTATDALATPVVYLPYVAACRNRRYTIHARTLTGVTVDIDDRGDSEDWAGPYTLLASGDQMTFRSTGIKWIVTDGIQIQ